MPWFSNGMKKQSNKESMESVCYEVARLSWTLCHVPAGQVHSWLQVEPDSYSTGPPVIVRNGSSRHGPVVSYSLSQCWSWHMSKRVQGKIVAYCPPRKASGVSMHFSSNLRPTNRCVKTAAAMLHFAIFYPMLRRLAYTGGEPPLYLRHLILWFWRRACSSCFLYFFCAKRKEAGG